MSLQKRAAERLVESEQKKSAGQPAMEPQLWESVPREQPAEPALSLSERAARRLAKLQPRGALERQE